MNDTKPHHTTDYHLRNFRGGVGCGGVSNIKACLWERMKKKERRLWRCGLCNGMEHIRVKPHYSGTRDKMVDLSVLWSLREQSSVEVDMEEGNLPWGRRIKGLSWDRWNQWGRETLNLNGCGSYKTYLEGALSFRGKWWEIWSQKREKDKISKWIGISTWPEKVVVSDIPLEGAEVTEYRNK